MQFKSDTAAMYPYRVPWSRHSDTRSRTRKNASVSMSLVLVPRIDASTGNYSHMLNHQPHSTRWRTCRITDTVWINHLSISQCCRACQTALLPKWCTRPLGTRRPKIIHSHSKTANPLRTRGSWWKFYRRFHPQRGPHSQSEFMVMDVILRGETGKLFTWTSTLLPIICSHMYTVYQPWHRTGT